MKKRSCICRKRKVELLENRDMFDKIVRKFVESASCSCHEHETFYESSQCILKSCIFLHGLMQKGVQPIETSTADVANDEVDNDNTESDDTESSDCQIVDALDLTMESTNESVEVVRTSVVGASRKADNDLRPRAVVVAAASGAVQSTTASAVKSLKRVDNVLKPLTDSGKKTMTPVSRRSLSANSIVSKKRRTSSTTYVPNINDKWFNFPGWAEENGVCTPFITVKNVDNRRIKNLNDNRNMIITKILSGKRVRHPMHEIIWDPSIELKPDILCWNGVRPTNSFLKPTNSGFELNFACRANYCDFYSPLRATRQRHEEMIGKNGQKHFDRRDEVDENDY